MPAPEKKLRVALMISGQLRTFRDVWPGNLENLSCPRVDVDVYIDTWAEYGSTDRTFPGYRGKISKKLFDPFLYSWESKSSFDPEAVRAVIPGADLFVWANEFEEILSADSRLKAMGSRIDPAHHRAFLSTAAMYYLVEKSFERVLEKPVTYDYFLRIRPDWVLRRNIICELIDRQRDLIFFDSSVEAGALGWGYVTDICFGGNLESMRVACSSFSDWVSKVEQEGWKRYRQAHSAHGHLLLAESVLSFQLRNFRKFKRVAVADAHAGYILRDGRDVDSRRKLIWAEFFRSKFFLFVGKLSGSRSR